jgi:hypothetical protein
MKKIFLEDKLKKGERNSKLALNYKKRMENFVVRMTENPIVLNEYVEPGNLRYFKMRQEDPTKFLGDA